MINSFKFFQSYEPCLGKKKKIKVPKASFSPIAGKGSIQIYDKICLNSIIHVPKSATTRNLIFRDYVIHPKNKISGHE